MRLVLDTNNAVSALLWGGIPEKLIQAAQVRTVTLLTTIPLLAELRGVLEREKFGKQLAARGLSVADIFDGYADLAEIVTPAEIPPTILRDPPDDRVLAAALGGNADLIVSGDDDLLNLKRFHSIEIVAAAEAIERIGKLSDPR